MFRIVLPMYKLHHLNAFYLELTDRPRWCFFFGSIIFVTYVSFCHAGLSVHCNLVVNCWERANLLALLFVMFCCVFVTFPWWCPVSGVVLDCIDS